MRAFEDRNNPNNRRTPRCSYCGNKDHKVLACQQATADWLLWSKHRVPVSPTSSYPYYWAYCRDYTKWFDSAANAHAKIQAAKKREADKAQGRNSSTRSKPKCGFCGNPNHNRRNCTTMATVVANAAKASQNWRKAFYKRFVKELGISEGAAVKVKKRLNYSEFTEAIALVTSVNWDEVNFLCYDNSVEWDYRPRLKVQVLVGGEAQSMLFEDGVLKDRTSQLVASQYGGYYNSTTFVEVISRSERELGEEWVTEAMADEFGWLTKKRSESRLVDLGIIGAINSWK